MYWFVHVEYNIMNGEFSVVHEKSHFTVVPKDLSYYNDKRSEFGFNIPAKDGWIQTVQKAIDMASYILDQRLENAIAQRYEEEQDAKHVLLDSLCFN